MKRMIVIVMAAVLAGLAGCDEDGKSKGLKTKKTAPAAKPEIVLVTMGGYLQTADTMNRIERAIIRQIHSQLPGYKVVVKQRLLGLLPEGDSELFLGLEYDAWKQKKATPEGSRNLFIAVGHSSGATAIYNLLRNGTFESGPNAPTFLGLVDMVLPSGPHDLRHKIPRNESAPTLVVHYHLGGTTRIRGIPNVLVRGDHFSIIRSRAVLHGLASGAANACVLSDRVAP